MLLKVLAVTLHYWFLYNTVMKLIVEKCHLVINFKTGMKREHYSQISCNTIFRLQKMLLNLLFRETALTLIIN